MKKFFFIFFLFQAINASAQKIEQGLDYSFNPTEYAPRYWAITEKKDSLWHRQVWFVPEANIAMEGWYKDTEAKTPHGKISYYHENRMIKSIESYNNGKKEGITLKFNEEGLMQDSANYSAGRLKGIRIQWYKDGMPADSMQFDGAGNGVEVGWHEDGTPAIAGRWVSDTAKQGRWQYFHANGKLKATEDYVNGKRTTWTCFDEAGQPLDTARCQEIEAEFPGGLTAWRRFIERNLNAHVPVKKNAPFGQYTVVMQFIVDKEGNVSGIKSRTKFGFGMEEEVERMLKKSPRWIPAQQWGRKVNAYRLQPITFVVTKG